MTAPAFTEADRHDRLSEWVDRHSGRIMVLPAVIILLAFAIFPLIVSAYLALSRFALQAGSFKLTFIGLYNFQRMLVGAQQYHFLGSLKAIGATGWIFAGLVALGLVVWLARYARSELTVLGF